MRVVSADDAFGAFVRDAEVRLRRAFVAAYGTDRAAEATAEALAWAFIASTERWCFDEATSG